MVRHLEAAAYGSVIFIRHPIVRYQNQAEGHDRFRPLVTKPVRNLLFIAADCHFFYFSAANPEVVACFRPRNYENITSGDLSCDVYTDCKRGKLLPREA